MRIISLMAVGAVALLVGSCATMNEEQCLAGDWSGQGYSDGAAGHGWNRLEDHREACARHGVTPDEASYYDGHQRGVRTYCQPGRGFSVGRSGGGYSNGFCPADLEQNFLYAYADGRLVWDAQQRYNEVVNAINSHNSRADSLEAEIRSIEDQMDDEGVTDEQRQTFRARIRRLREERQDALDDARDRERDLEYARREISALENRFIPVYGNW